MKRGIRGHSSFSVHFFFAVLAVVLAVALECDHWEWCIVAGCIGMVITAELFNSAIETLFRGLEPDAGTVFEVGYAAALGLPVVAYGVPEASYEQRVCAAIGCARDAQGAMREAGSGTMVEGLGQRMNLMLTRSTAIEADAAAALRRIAALLGR